MKKRNIRILSINDMPFCTNRKNCRTTTVNKKMGAIIQRKRNKNKEYFKTLYFYTKE